MLFTAASPPASFNSCSNSSRIARCQAFCTAGRLSVIVATAPCRSTMMNSWLGIGGSFRTNDRVVDEVGDRQHADEIARMDERDPVARPLARRAVARYELRKLGVEFEVERHASFGVLDADLRAVVGDQAVEPLEPRRPAPADVDRADERARRDPVGIE